MVFAMFLLTAGDALTKHVGSHLPIGQVIFFRALFIYIPVAVLVYGSGYLNNIKGYRPKRPGNSRNFLRMCHHRYRHIDGLATSG